MNGKSSFVDTEKCLPSFMASENNNHKNPQIKTDIPEYTDK